MHKETVHRWPLNVARSLFSKSTHFNDALDALETFAGRFEKFHFSKELVDTIRAVRPQPRIAAVARPYQECRKFWMVMPYF